ncbi:hypothetical protein HYFRA_00001316 [Hymenoscyphus fraxineus]|uniref:DUF2264 domain-containing protein n=1 Tax=Hymenoscyphus fraxineus TaxID=746836 RepID=A0A9N9L7C5_9HELO|nr:hypothetical protein HYFRA_00001316 [Hymenoscyphus fraxineus]
MAGYLFVIRGTATRFDLRASEIEGFSRPLWGLAALLAGGGTSPLTSHWIAGLKAGTDPSSPEFWGWARDNDQRMVEMCPLGFLLAVAPQVWEALDKRERENVESWLGGGVNAKEMPDTNWLWFRVFANLGLKRNGGRYSQERIERDMERLNEFFRGEGWSNDGPVGIWQQDYYSGSFAIQFLQLLYAEVEGGDDPVRAREFRKRAQDYALDFVYYFDEEGRATPFGRSVGYRFAMAGFWGALAFADVELPAPLTWGMVKGLLLRNLRWWQTQRDIWSPTGTLTIGYCYPNMYMAENYNSPMSPMWACLAFICLAVPESHPFWTSEEEAYPTHLLEKTKALKHPGHIVSYLGGHKMILSSGQACSYPMKGTHAKYGSFAYSSAYGYSVPTGCFTLEQFALASQLGLSDDGGEVWKTRRLCESAVITYHESLPVLESIWKPFPDVKITTYLIPPVEETPNWHLRIHRIEAGREVMTADGAFAICNERMEDGRYLDLYSTETHEGTLPKIIGNYDLDTPEGRSSGEKGAFAVSKGAVGICALEESTAVDDSEAGGKRKERWAMLVNADPNSNLISSRTVIPTLQDTIKKGEIVWYVTAIYAKPEKEGVERSVYLDGWERRPVIPGWVRKEMEIGV